MAEAMDKDSIIAALMGMSPADFANGFSNGAKSFGDQAKWMMGGFGNAPQPAPYDGGPNYPAQDDANAYVRNNYPADGMHPFHQPRFEKFYTPYGGQVPPGGREPSAGEVVDGAPGMSQLATILAGLRSPR